jgi:magnesium-protoporphyrin IX monomethyl ester (oxidative) cyclase
LIKTLKNLPHIAAIGINLLRLYVMKPIDTLELEGTVR